MYSYLADIQVFQFDSLDQFPAITHFVTTRNGVNDSDAYSSFNICHYTGDSDEAVAATRERLAEALGIDADRIVVPRQVHGDRIGVVEHSSFNEEVDAVITNRRGMCLTVSTADCVPVLLYCPKQQVVAAVHAGWRGMVKRIISKTVCRMVEQFGCDAADIRAAIGPSISPEAFEVGAEVALAFEEVGFEWAVLPSPIAGKAYIDLWHGAKSDLLAAEVLTENIETAAICTWQQHDRFFSARRLGIRSGRISSGIMLK